MEKSKRREKSAIIGFAFLIHVENRNKRRREWHESRTKPTCGFDILEKNTSSATHAPCSRKKSGTTHAVPGKIACVVL